MCPSRSQFLQEHVAEAWGHVLLCDVSLEHRRGPRPAAGAQTHACPASWLALPRWASAASSALRPSHWVAQRIREALPSPGGCGPAAGVDAFLSQQFRLLPCVSVCVLLYMCVYLRVCCSLCVCGCVRERKRGIYTRGFLKISKYAITFMVGQFLFKTVIFASYSFYPHL